MAGRFRAFTKIMLIQLLCTHNAPGVCANAIRKRYLSHWLESFMETVMQSLFFNFDKSFRKLLAETVYYSSVTHSRPIDQSPERMEPV
ncbi:hypothetical protein CEXT_318381 [Caerostris extrusa]|uniref:Secreted protein n=1 Tax=Caerostris extrusa TaxID=172846 RepID=A0AAV4MWN5_CAEEX|nr:hypothetical protein CEXT_318381 [Caerostris extrusa]